MAQHSHSVYGNLFNPAPNYYQKNRAGNNSNILSNQKSQVVDKQKNKAHLLSVFPFSNRNGKLHRSNPQLHFGGSSHENHQAVKPNPGFNQSKWKSDITYAANNIPRKLCDFVFRRNADNQVYRSESFRFIQKTNSLSLLPPLSAGLSKYRNKHLQQVPVSDDYVEPLDHVIGARQSSVKGPKSTSVGTGRGVASEDDDEDNCPPYSEIIKCYNAPYYYSDTIKEPTYCSPCPSWRQSCGDLSVKNLVPTSPDNGDEIKKEELRSSRSSRFRNRSGGSGRPMARKRYETAFISSSTHHSSQSTFPDVDGMLLAIESSGSSSRISDDSKRDYKFGTSHQDRERIGFEDERREGNNWSTDAQSTERDRAQLIVCSSSSNRIRPDPSISYCQSMNHSHSITHTSGSTTTTNSSPLSDKKPKPTMPLSEPLPQKRYTNMVSSSGSSSVPSTSTSLTSCRPSDKRLLLTMMKDNSVSSLESIDSAKSEDLSSFSRPFAVHRGGSHYGHFGRQGTNCKLLSPISDKSPLEPGSVLQSEGGNDGHGLSTSSYNHQSPWPNHEHHLMSATELTNVPWDMPKLKRRLALLADSGISLDCPGNYQGDSGHFTAGSDRDRDSCEDPSNFQYTSSHIRRNLDLRIATELSDCSEYAQTETNNKQHSLHLGYDNPLVQDEYYEDPRLHDHEPHEMVYNAQAHPLNSQLNRPKSLSNRPGNVTSVQVHVSGPGHEPGAGKPDRCRMKLNFGEGSNNPFSKYEIDPTIELEAQEWFHGAITRSEAENILRSTKEGSFLVRNCESSSFNRYSLSLKSARGFIHIRIEPNSLGTFSLGEQEFDSVSHLVLHFMCHRLPIKGAEHVKLMYPVITQLL